MPPSIGNDGDSPVQAEQILGALDLKDMAHTGQGLDLVEIGPHTPSRIHRTLVVNGIEHTGNFEVDAIERSAGDDTDVVDAGCGMADDFVVLGIFELDGFEVGSSQRRCFFGQLAVSERALCGLMDDAAGRSGTFGFRGRPGLRGGGDKHLAARGTYAAQRIPIDRRGRAATGALRTVLRFLKIGLFDAHIFPIDVQLFGDEHGQARFDALSDFRILGHDGDHIVASDAHKGVWLECGCGRLRRGGLSSGSKCFGGGLEMIGKQKTATGKGGNFEKSATVQKSGVHGASSGNRHGSGGLTRLAREAL